MDQPKKDERTWLFCEECPEGAIFNTLAEVEEAIAEGWVDSPKKIGDEPAVNSDSDEPITELKGGWFQVQHGDVTEKVQGRDAAEAKLAELQAAAT